MKNLWTFLFLLFLASASFAFEKNCNGIEDGTKAYNQGDYERAIDEWQTCVDNGFENPDLYYNLGNAYFRSEKLGFSIFYYKKALRINANDEDIQHNLKFAKSMTKDKVEDGEENPILSGLFKAHHFFSLKSQLYILLSIFWIIAIICIICKLVFSNRKKNICLGSIFLLLTTFSVIGASAAYKIFIAETDITGVVTATNADVTSAPNDKSQTLNTLSEGTDFEVLSIQGNFAEIRLGEKIKGFVRLSDVGIVK